jgi:hypothetical protein
MDRRGDDGRNKRRLDGYGEDGGQQEGGRGQQQQEGYQGYPGYQGYQEPRF